MNPDVIRVSSIAGIAAAIPYLLGFHPTESLVVIGIESGQLHFTMRVDLPPVDLEQAVVGDATLRMTAYDEVLVAVFTDDPSSDHHPMASLVHQLVDALRVRDALLIRRDRVWSYLCTDLACCPPEGVSYRGTADADGIAAAHILRGRRVLDDREQLLATLISADPRAGEAVSGVLPLARSAIADLSHDERMGALTRLLAVTLARLDDPRQQLATQEVAEYVALLDDVRVRDLFIERLASTGDPTARTLLDRLMLAAPTGADAQICAAKSFLAYLDGDGVIAKAAAERALRSQPDHRLSAMLLGAVDRGVSPRHLRRLIGD